MHPNGALPAYEFAFSDVNPPVHAWAAWRVYKITGARGQRDIRFLESVFQKLLMNFTWWVNRKDSSGRNLFSGGFLGLDNVGVFDRSKPLRRRQLPRAGRRHRVDGAYCLTMLAHGAGTGRRTIRFTRTSPPSSSSILSAITHAINTLGGRPLGRRGRLLLRPDFGCQWATMCRSRSVPSSGLLPLIAVAVAPERNHRAPARISGSGCIGSCATGRNWRCTFPKSTISAIGQARRRACWPFRRATNSSACCATCSTRMNFFRPTASVPFPRYHKDHPYTLELGVRGLAGRLHARRQHHRALRRQLQLARPDLVPDQLPDRRGAGTVPPFLRRCAEGGMPHRFGPHDEPHGRSPRRSSGAWLRSSCPGRMARGPMRLRSGATPTIRSGGTTFSSTNISTATTAAVSGPVTRPAGPR